jgi:type II secretory pathway pseudopilin PulG
MRQGASHPVRRGAGRAFTLVEVLIALGLILFLSASLLSYLWSLIDRRDTLITVAAQQSAAGAVLEQLEHDLSTTFAADTAGNAGVKGGVTGIVVRCRGTNLITQDTDLSDLQGSEIRLGPGVLSARRLTASPGPMETVAEGVERIRFRYFDGKEWLEEFDSAAKGELPVAIEASVWFGEAGPAAPSEDAPRTPDRTRVMVVPDGPVAAWKAGAT